MRRGKEGYCAECGETKWSDKTGVVLVMRGQKRVEDARERAYDPRVHLLRERFLRRWMDCRVKPGNDGADGYVRLVHVPRLSSCRAPSERNPQVQESGVGAISIVSD